MVRAIFRNADGSTRVLNWWTEEDKPIGDLIHDFHAVSVELVGNKSKVKKIVHSRRK